MKARKIATALVLVLIGNALLPMGHAAAATLRTSPFNAFDISHGAARCVVTNGSTVTGSTTLKLFSATGELLDSVSDVLSPHQSGDPMGAFPMGITALSPTYCECTVPNATTWRCSFVYMDTLDGSPSVITNIDGR